MPPDKRRAGPPDREHGPRKSSSVARRLNHQSKQTAGPHQAEPRLRAIEAAKPPPREPDRRPSPIASQGARIVGGADRIPRARLRYLARRTHRLGERRLYELPRELDAGAPLHERYPRLDPGVVKLLGADALPPPAGLVE
jgi:hypothetical protein